MVDRAVERSLQSIQAALHGIADDQDPIDPDAILAVLARETPKLESLLASLMASEIERSGVTDLNTIASEALRAALGSTAVPVVTRSRLAAHLPAIALSQPELRGILARCLQLALDRAGNGGEVSLETKCEGSEVRARVGAQRGDGQSAAVLPFAERSLTLTAMLDDLGVAHDVSEGGDELAIELRFAAAAV
jgi:hypothetical protein